MKTTDPRDPLDKTIDALLESRPLKPEDDFARRVVAAAEAIEPEAAAKPGSTGRRIIAFALPIAAAIALAFVLLNQLNVAPLVDGSNTQIAVSDPATVPTDDISGTFDDALAQEIFLLEEGLSGFTIADGDSLPSEDLYDTLDAFLTGIES